MDVSRFNRLSRALFSQSSRRWLLAGFSGGLVARLPQSLGIENAEARRKKRKKKCKGGTKRCGKQCRDLLTDSANCGACGNDCDGLPCIHGACACKGLGGCPENCSCAARKEGLNACIGELSSDPCTMDADCPAGTVCLLANVCSERCTGIPD